VLTKNNPDLDKPDKNKFNFSNLVSTKEKKVKSKKTELVKSIKAASGTIGTTEEPSMPVFSRNFSHQVYPTASQAEKKWELDPLLKKHTSEQIEALTSPKKQPQTRFNEEQLIEKDANTYHVNETSIVSDQSVLAYTN